MVQDLYVLMITAAVVSILFKFLKQPVVLGYIGLYRCRCTGWSSSVWQEPCECGQCEGMGRHRCAVRIVLHRSGVPPEEPHQQRQGGSNRCVDNHCGHDVLRLPRGMGCQF